jgi:hypothetical protein
MTCERPIDRELVADIPQGIVDFVRSLVRVNWMAERVLVRASVKVLRRLKPHPEDARNTAARRARWATRWRPENQAQTMRWLGQVRDVVVHQHHQLNVAEHETFAELPYYLQSWKPAVDGTLLIDEPRITNPSFGSGSFLEQTPIKLLRWVHQTWLAEQLANVVEDIGLDWALKPTLWDLTAGSGTATDYFSHLHECEVIATDLTVVGGGGIEACDARRFDSLNARRRRRLTDVTTSTVVVPTPHIILIDPPSRGLPLHSQAYGNEPPPHDINLRDLGLLDRDQWIATVADIAGRAVAHLAEGGFVSLLLRCGFRFHSDVVAEPGVLDDFKAALPSSVVVTHEMPLPYRTVRNQTSLGTSRVPAVHLTLRKAQ